MFGLVYVPRPINTIDKKIHFIAYLVIVKSVLSFDREMRSKYDTGGDEKKKINWAFSTLWCRFTKAFTR